MAPRESRPVKCWVALEEATVGVDKVEGCEVPANDEGVHDIAKGSRLHKKLQAKEGLYSPPLIPSGFLGIPWESTWNDN